MIQERLLQLNLFNSPLLTICMRSHSVTITISKFYFILRHDRVVIGKDTTITTHSSDCPYILYHTISHQNSPTTAGLYLSNKSMSYILIKGHLV